MNRQLKRKFNEYNKKYFGGKLPADTVVDWHYALKDNAMGRCHVHGVTACNQIPKDYGNGKCNEKHLILINTDLYNNVFVSLMTLLHEMVHLEGAVGNRKQAESHGKEFTARMRKLATQGAFDKLW